MSEEQPAPPQPASALVDSPAAPEGADPRDALAIQPRVLLFFDFA